MKRDNKLEILDFTSSIRSESINYNFSIVEEWIERERLRTGGWGIAEGFDMSYPDNDFCIHITEGVLITKEGKELLDNGDNSYKNIEIDPEAFKVLTRELMGLGLDIKLMDKDNKEINMDAIARQAQKEEHISMQSIYGSNQSSSNEDSMFADPTIDDDVILH